MYFCHPHYLRAFHHNNDNVVKCYFWVKLTFLRTRTLIFYVGNCDVEMDNVQYCKVIVKLGLVLNVIFWDNVSSIVLY